MVDNRFALGDIFQDELFGLGRAVQPVGGGVVAPAGGGQCAAGAAVRAAGQLLRHHQRQVRPVLRGLRLLLPVGPGRQPGAPLSPAPPGRIGGRRPAGGRGGGLPLLPGDRGPGGHVAPGPERHFGRGGRHQSGRAHPCLRLPGDCGPGLPDGVEGRGAVPFSPQSGDRRLLFPRRFAPPTALPSGWPPSRRRKKPGCPCAPGASSGWGRRWPNAGRWPRRSTPWAWTPFPSTFSTPWPALPWRIARCWTPLRP